MRQQRQLLPYFFTLAFATVFVQALMLGYASAGMRRVHRKRNCVYSIGIVCCSVPGREVATPVNEDLKPGQYETTWNAQSFPSGVYFYRLHAGNYFETRKLVLLK